MALLEGLAQFAHDEGGQADALASQQTPGQLGVEQRGRAQAHLRQAGQVLRRRMQDPLDSLGGRIDDGQVGHLDGIDERSSGTLPADLDEVGPLAVAVARRTFSVQGQRTGAPRQELGELTESLLIDDHLGNAIARLERRQRGRFLGDL